MVSTTITLVTLATSITGSLGMVYNVTEALNLRFNVARGFRAPTVSELSSNGVHEGSIQYEIGNGICAMGRNVVIKVNIPLDIHL